MNTELLLEHFHRLGDAPDAVLQLRRFMLELAVEGAFLNDSDHERWPTKPLGELCEFKGGLWTGKKPPFASAKVLRVTNITKECEMNVANAIELDVEVKQLATRTLQPGDILIEKSGGGDNQPVGRVALFSENDGVYSFSNFTTVMRIVDRDLISPDYLHDFLRSFYFKGGTLPLQNNATNLRNLQLEDYKQVEVPLPPLPEQHRIVAKVEELMALCDRLEAAQQQREAERTRLTAAAWQAVVQAEAPAEVSFALEQLPALTTRPAQVKALRQTILDLAVRGRLVEQDAKDEPAEVLLERMSVERTGLVAKREFKKTQPLPPVTSDEQDFEAPKGWAWTRFGVIGDWGSGSTPSRSISEYYNGTHTWLKSGELNDVIGLTGSEEKVTDRALKECSFRLNRKGDVLIAMYGATIGKLAVLGEDAVTNQAVCGCTVLSGMLNRYLFLQLLAMRSAFHGQSEGGAQPNISKEKIINTPFPLPPLAEQRRIVAKVEELMALCDGLEAALAAGEALRGQVLEAVVRSDDQMIRRSDNGPRPEVVQKPKVRVPRYVEPEEELELAVAAEPVGHTGAMQAVVRRGPGRPHKSDAPAGAQSGSVIPMERVLEPTAVPGEVEDWITHSDMEAGIRRTFLPGMRMQREAALRALAIAKGHGRLGKHIKEEMEVLLDELLYSGLLVEDAAGIGLPGHATKPQNKRGPGRPRKGEAPDLANAQQAIAAYLHAHPGWHGKAAILEATGVEAGAWNAAIKELLEAGKVERQGEKKGARYRGR